MQRVFALTLLAAFATAAYAETVTGPCAFTWNRVDDSRVKGYRFYINNAMTAENITSTQVSCEAAKLPKNKEVEVYVTAVGTPPAESAPSNKLRVTWSESTAISSPTGLSLVGQWQAQLSGSEAVVNLTTEGTIDWAHWGLSKPTDVNRKVGVAAQIGPLKSLDETAFNRFSEPQRPSFEWDNGTPQATAKTRSGVYLAGVNRGYLLTTPADTSTRTLVIYVGGWNTEGLLEARLSDGSATPYRVVLSPANDDPSRTDYDVRVAITYRAASAGQALTVNYSVKSGSGTLFFTAATLR